MKVGATVIVEFGYFCVRCLIPISSRYYAMEIIEIKWLN